MPKKKNRKPNSGAAALLQKIAAHGWKQSGAVPEQLSLLVKYVDEEVAASVVNLSANGNAHDNLFEVMMARFDILQKHRKAILTIVAEVKRDPSLLRHLLPAQLEAMRKMLKLAKLKQESAAEFLAPVGLLGVHAIALRSWERDTTKDMAPTMAALDRHLRRAGKMAEIIFRAV